MGDHIRAVFLVARYITDGIANAMFNIEKTAVITGQTGKPTLALGSFPKNLFPNLESFHCFLWISGLLVRKTHNT